MTLEAVKYRNGQLHVLDQLLLPHETIYLEIRDTQDGWRVIKNMQVRGAPAIGVVGSLSLAVETRKLNFNSMDELAAWVEQKLEYLVSARPTAVNMQDCERRINEKTHILLNENGATIHSVKLKLVAFIESLLSEDVSINKAMAAHGAAHVLLQVAGQPVIALTHCNTGSLATAGYGTALGVVRSLQSQGRLAHCFCTETRPYNQGARLTAYELVYENIPSTLICDSMAASLMKEKKVNAVFVGADRVVANGDTANKIGTYQLAIVAKHHNVIFYVVAPSSSIDLTLPSGDKIIIEQRPQQELTNIKGMRIAAPGIGVWNPAFDVTPADLITGGIVTEHGVFNPAQLQAGLTAARRSKGITVATGQLIPS